MATITLDRLEKRFGEFGAVEDLTLEIADGEFVCLLGPSGCGKTTTLRMIAGLETPTSGEIRFDGVRMNDVPARRRGVGLVFQNYALFTHLSVYDNLAFGLRVRGEPSQDVDRAVRETAALLELEPLLETSAGRVDLSTMQRVALGRTLITRPRVLLLDEPLNNIRPGLREAMRGELRRLQQELRQTTVYVTHDQEEALSLADRVAIMRTGHLEQVGAPDEIYGRPVNTFVAGFVGSPGMNFVPVIAQPREGRMELVSGGMRIRADRWAGRLAAGVRLVAGIRPEAIQIGTGSMRARVALVQSLGSEQIVELSVDGHTVKALVPTRQSFSAGQNVTIEFAPQRIVLFDARDARALPDA